MASDQETLDRLSSQTKQQAAQIAALQEQLKSASGFRDEALSLREQNAALTASLADRESSLLTTIRDLSEARSLASSLQGRTDDKVTAAAKDLARAIQVLLKA